MERIKHKKVFVTGGAGGIGKAIVRAFCKAGARVAFCDIDDRAAREVCNELAGYGTCLYLPADVADADALTRVMNELFRRWGTIDILINNAGISRFAPLTETTVEEFDRILRTNLRPVFITSRTLAVHRASQPTTDTYGRIVNIASTRYLMSEPDSESYAASKGGIVSLTHALALSLSPYRLTVNCISPGWIETKNYRALSEADHRQHPSGRVGTPDDIARACLFLCHPQNDFINGENLVIDGGMTKKMIYTE